MNILVTGSAGFVGQYMCAELRKHGHKVIPFDIVTGNDLLNPDHVAAPFLDFQIDAISHLGAQAHLGNAERDPIMNAKVNIIGTINILDAALKHNAKVIYHSTGAVYSDECAQPVAEDAPREPKSHYGASKLCAEEYAMLYVRRGLRLIRTRFSSVYGVGREVAPVNIFTKKAIANEHIQVYGAEITRDYTHVSDVVRGVRMLLESDSIAWNGQCFNVASGRETRTIEVIKMVEERLGRPVDYEIMPAKKGDVMRNYFNISKLRTLGYAPMVSLGEGVQALIQHYQGKNADNQVITPQSGE